MSVKLKNGEILIADISEKGIMLWVDSEIINEKQGFDIICPVDYFAEVFESQGNNFSDVTNGGIDILVGYRVIYEDTIERKIRAFEVKLCDHHEIEEDYYDWFSYDEKYCHTVVMKTCSVCGHKISVEFAEMK